MDLATHTRALHVRGTAANIDLAWVASPVHNSHHVTASSAADLMTQECATGTA